MTAGGSPDGTERETARVRAIYDRQAPRYDRMGDGFLPRDGRSWLAGQVRGETLDVGIGTGRNLERYPDDLPVTGIEVSEAMLELARVRAQRLGRVVDLRLGDAQALPFPDASFDTVVFCLSLCSIPDDRLAFAEGVRVLRTGGRIVALEHVRSPRLAIRLIERAWDPIAVRMGGDHLLRDPLDHAQAHGLEIVTLERYRLGLIERLVAVKPAR